ncbi:NAD(P)-binding protein [Aspergillus saccharolyticus JOP 1030-1]|uniref:NAD(P)-binding protein n=1 Tax=Aspergillus saccharolyticus JOP 1030-1 TaxID=1450539 RepID=A0A318ZEI2_9EURO|nr:NAD(P)-binding protein [Aspergillus saccharolyticus JOP 1030-1]PYH45961.1 NAD(P)-binding protein [Aspergillus saccharolyticus JOP 1030-1]
MPDKSPSPVVIVTGGADGFGAAIVGRFSLQGWKVLLVDIDAEKGALKAQDDSSVLFVHGDVSDPRTWLTVKEVALHEWGRIDALINNAAIVSDAAPIHEQDMNTFDKIFAVNVKPIFLSAQAIAPFMLEQGHGVFINISSTGYTRPRAGFAIYNASKAAVTTATKTLALEYAPTIRFNCIAPAVGETQMLFASTGRSDDAAERRAKVEEMIPLKRLTRPEDVSNAAWYLASDQSSFVTGTILEVDGGRGI